jgi:hypothetical protein
MESERPSCKGFDGRLEELLDAEWPRTYDEYVGERLSRPDIPQRQDRSDVVARISTYAFPDMDFDLTNPALYHFMFEEHIDKNLGNTTERAMRFVKTLIDAHSAFAGMHEYSTIRHILGESLDLQNEWLVLEKKEKTEKRSYFTEWFDNFDRHGIVAIPVSTQGFSDHQWMVLFREIRGDDGGMEIVMINTGDGRRYQDQEVCVVYRRKEFPEDPSLEMVDVAFDMFCHKTKFAPEKVYRKFYRCLECYGFFKIAKSHTNYPRFTPQAGGGCTMWSTWWSIMYAMCNSPCYKKNVDGRWMASSAEDVDDARLFCSCLCARSAMVYMSDKRILNTGRGVLRLLLSGNYLGSRYRLMYDGKTSETLHSYARRRMLAVDAVDGMGPLFRQPTGGDSIDFVREMGSGLIVPMKTPKKRTPIKLKGKGFIGDPTIVPLAELIENMWDCLKGLFEVLEIGGSIRAEITHKTSPFIMLAAANAKAAAVNAAMGVLFHHMNNGTVGLRKAREDPRVVDCVKWMGQVASRTDISSEVFAYSMSDFIGYQNRVRGGNEMFLCMLFCVARLFEGELRTSRRGMDVAHEDVLASFAGAFAPISYEIFSLDGKTPVRHIGKMLRYLKENVADILPLHKPSDATHENTLMTHSVKAFEGSTVDVMDSVIYACGWTIAMALRLRQQLGCWCLVDGRIAVVNKKATPHWSRSTLFDGSNHLEVLSSLMREERSLARDMSDLAGHMKFMSCMPIYIDDDDDDGGKCIRLEGGVIIDERASLGDRTKLDMMMQYMAADASKCLANISRIPLERINVALIILVSAYLSFPRALSHVDVSSCPYFRDDIHSITEDKQVVLKHLSAVSSYERERSTGSEGLGHSDAGLRRSVVRTGMDVMGLPCAGESDDDREMNFCCAIAFQNYLASPRLGDAVDAFETIDGLKTRSETASLIRSMLLRTFGVSNAGILDDTRMVGTFSFNRCVWSDATSGKPVEGFVSIDIPGCLLEYDVASNAVMAHIDRFLSFRNVGLPKMEGSSDAHAVFSHPTTRMYHPIESVSAVKIDKGIIEKTTGTPVGRGDANKSPLLVRLLHQQPTDRCEALGVSIWFIDRPKAYAICGLVDGGLIFVGGGPKNQPVFAVCSGNGKVVEGTVVDGEGTDLGDAVYIRWLCGFVCGILVKTSLGEYFVIVLEDTSDETLGEPDDAIYGGGSWLWRMSKIRQDQELRHRPGDRGLCLMAFEVNLTGICINRALDDYDAHRRLYVENQRIIDSQVSLCATGIGFSRAAAGKMNDEARYQWSRAVDCRRTFRLNDWFKDVIGEGESFAAWIETLGGGLRCECRKTSQGGNRCGEYEREQHPCCIVGKASIPRTSGGEMGKTAGLEKQPATVQGWMDRIQSSMKGLERRTFSPENVSIVLACSLGATKSDEEYVARHGATDPWPPSVAEQIASDYDGMCVWIYGMLLLAALRRTEKRLQEIIDDESSETAGCTDLLYAFEYLSSATVDYGTERTLPMVLAEVSSGYIMKTSQAKLLKKIRDMDAVGGGGIAWQLSMALGKTSFITPELVFKDLLRGGRTMDGDWTSSVVVVVPQTLVVQTAQILTSMCSVVGLVDVDVVCGDFGVGPKVDRDAVNLLMPDRNTTHLDNEDRDIGTIPGGCVTIVGDKSLQRFYLSALRYHDETNSRRFMEKIGSAGGTGRINTAIDAIGLSAWLELFVRRWRRSLILCDEVDRVVDPLACEMNSPLMDSLKKPENTKSTISMIIREPRIEDIEDDIQKRMVIDKIRECKAVAGEMTFDVTYGFGSEDWGGARTMPKNHMMAIPYSSAHDPMNGSQFTDFELSLVLTRAAYANMISRTAGEGGPRFRRCDVDDLVRSIVELSGGSGRVVGPKAMFKEALPSVDGRIIDALVSVVDGKETPEDAAVMISGRLASMTAKDRDEFVDQYTQNIMEKYGDFSTKQMSTGMREFLMRARCRSCVMFSGTVQILTPTDRVKDLLKSVKGYDPDKHVAISEVRPDTFTESMVEAVFSGCECPKEEQRPASSSGGGGGGKPPRKKQRVKRVSKGKYPPRPTLKVPEVRIIIDTGDRDDVDERIINTFCETIKSDDGHEVPKYDALIDSIGIMRMANARVYAMRIAKRAKRSVLFVEGDGTRSVLKFDGATGTVDPRPKPETFATRHEGCAIFYDQKSTVGIDFVQPRRMNGLLILDKKIAWTTAAQALFRLRGLQRGSHSFDYALIVDKSTEYRRYVDSRGAKANAAKFIGDRTLEAAADEEDGFMKPRKRAKLFAENQNRKAKEAKNASELAMVVSAIRSLDDIPDFRRHAVHLWTESMGMNEQPARAEKESMTPAEMRHLAREDTQRRDCDNHLLFDRRRRGLDRPNWPDWIAKYLEIALGSDDDLAISRKIEVALRVEKQTDISSRVSKDVASGYGAWPRQAMTYLDYVHGNRPQFPSFVTRNFVDHISAMHRVVFMTDALYSMEHAAHQSYRRRMQSTITRRREQEIGRGTLFPVEVIYKKKKKKPDSDRPDRALFVCSDLDAIIVMHAATGHHVDEMAGATLYSAHRMESLVSVVDGKLTQAKKHLSGPDLMMALCFGIPSKTDISPRAKEAIEKLPPNIGKMYMGLVLGENIVTNFSKFGGEFNRHVAGGGKLNPVIIESIYDLDCNERICRWCGGPAGLVCSRCRMAFFCCKECQRLDHRSSNPHRC